MKKIEAVIKPHKVDAVKEALAQMGVLGLTVSEVEGYGRQKGQAEFFLGSEVKPVDFVPKVKLEIVVDDDAAEAVEAAIVRTAHSGKIGDGKVFVYDVAQAVRIRTGERGPEAL